jgi:hypothetical protein
VFGPVNASVHVDVVEVAIRLLHQRRRHSGWQTEKSVVLLENRSQLLPELRLDELPLDWALE